MNATAIIVCQRMSWRLVPTRSRKGVAGASTRSGQPGFANSRPHTHLRTAPDTLLFGDARIFYSYAVRKEHSLIPPTPAFLVRSSSLHRACSLPNTGSSFLSRAEGLIPTSGREALWKRDIFDTPGVWPSIYRWNYPQKHISRASTS